MAEHDIIIIIDLEEEAIRQRGVRIIVIMLVAIASQLQSYLI